MAVQFASQMVGFGLASTASSVGPTLLLGVQAVLYVLGALSAFQLRSMAPLRSDAGSSAPQVRTLRSELADLRVALKEVLHSPKIAPVTGVMMGIGLFFISVFQVVVPVMVRDHYFGGSLELALVNAVFVIGVLITTTTLSRFGALRRQGLAMFVAACGGAAFCVLFSFEPPVLAFYALVLFFGCGAGVAMSVSRTVVQQAAPPAYRARILAIFSLAFLGAAPMGSLLIGQLGQHFGVLQAAALSGMGMAILLAVLAFRGGILRVRDTG